MSFLASNRKVLLLHDGELADFRSVLQSLGTQAFESLGGDSPHSWDLAIATPRYLQAMSSVQGDMRFRRIAVVDNESRTLRTLIRKSGIHIVVRRPVHPAALRLLIVHALYRGPERRKPRVAAGAPVGFRTGLKRAEGFLAEFSTEGCRLLTDHPLQEGQRLLLQIPDPEGKGMPIGVPGKVLRLGTGEGPSLYSAGIEYFWLTAGAKKRLDAAFAVYQRGPAKLVAPVEEAMVMFDPETDPGDSADNLGDRRRDPRVPYPHRVMAHDREASRVLIGRDLAVGGMRVDPHPDLRVGNDLRVAVHVIDGEEAIMLRARVLRDDGARGTALRFIDVDKNTEEKLRKMVSGTPRLEEANEYGEEEIILTEILPEDDEQLLH